MTTDAVTAPGRGGQRAALLEVRSLSKRFGEIQANWDVNLTVLPGTVHGLIGENGAGKSTLLKMIYGVYTPDEGAHVRRRRTPSHQAARRRASFGIGMVFQDLRLVPALTVAENIALALPDVPTSAPGRAWPRGSPRRREAYGSPSTRPRRSGTCRSGSGSGSRSSRS